MDPNEISTSYHLDEDIDDNNYKTNATMNWASSQQSYMTAPASTPAPPILRNKNNVHILKSFFNKLNYEFIENEEIIPVKKYKKIYVNNSFDDEVDRDENEEEERKNRDYAKKRIFAKYNKNESSDDGDFSKIPNIAISRNNYSHKNGGVGGGGGGGGGGLCVENLPFNAKTEKLYILKRNKENGKFSIHPIKILKFHQSPHEHDMAAFQMNEDQTTLSRLLHLKEKIRYDIEMFKQRTFNNCKLLLQSKNVDENLNNRIFRRTIEGDLKRLGQPVRDLLDYNCMRFERFQKDKSKALLRFNNRDYTKRFISYFIREKRPNTPLTFKDFLTTDQLKLHRFVVSENKNRQEFFAQVIDGEIFIFNMNDRRPKYRIRNEEEYYQFLL